MKKKIFLWLSLAAVLSVIAIVLISYPPESKRRTAASIFPCKKEPRDNNKLHLFYDILEFPDPCFNEIKNDNENEEKLKSISEGELFAQRITIKINKIIQKYGGSPPLEGPERIDFEREIYCAQGLLFFDMRLGANHSSRKAFHNLLISLFNAREPNVYSRGQSKVSIGKASIEKNELEFIKIHLSLRTSVNKKLSNILSKKDYQYLLAH